MKNEKIQIAIIAIIFIVISTGIFEWVINEFLKAVGI